MTTKTLPDSTTAAYYYPGSGVTLVNTGTQGRPGVSDINFGFVVSGNNDTLINNGTVFGQRIGVYVTGSGDSVINAAGKNITATEAEQAGVNFYNSSGTVTNYGTISGYAGATNGHGGNAVEMRHGGLVTNFGTLLNGGALFRLAPGTLVNTGVVLGNAAYGGVYMEAGGTVTNLAGGLISSNGAAESYGAASPYGVFIVGGAGTITNAGTINGGTGNAVLLPTGFQNRVIVDPGAVFVGTVNGGTAVDATLQLASAASEGTLSGLGIQFINFGTLAFDPSASWLVNASTLIASATITGFGTGDTIDLAGFVAVSDASSANTLVLTDAGGTQETLHIQGTFTAANFTIGSDGNGGTDLGFTTLAPAALVYGQTIDETGIVATTETVTAGVMTLFNGASPVGTIAVGTTLNTSDFTLRSDGSGGTDVIVSTVFGVYESGVTLLTNPTTIANTARVSETSGTALFGRGGSGWTINNYGVVNGGASAYGIQLGSGGSLVEASGITNAAGGSISGLYGIRTYNNANVNIVNLAGGTIASTGAGGGRAIDLEIDAGTVTNAGLITTQPGGAFDIGVELDGGGTVINTATGTITGGWGVLMQGAGTVINAGTISGVYTNEFAVAMNSGDRLIVDPGAVFVGAVNGARLGGSSTLELASAAGAGTLSTTNFSNFSAIIFDAGAAWTLQGNTTALAGTISGFTLGDTIDLTGFAAVSDTFASNTLVLTNTGGAHQTLHVQGSFDSGNFLLSGDGTGGTDIAFGTAPLLYGETIDETGIVATTETVAAGTMTLFNGASPVGTIAVGGTLNTSDFTLRSDGSGGTDVIVSTVFGTYSSTVTLLTNPTTIASTASISGAAASTTGVYGPAGTTWILTNQGQVNENGTGSYGISFASAGTITNTGGITGARTGIALDDGGSVTNQLGGTISGYYGIESRNNPATVVNAGSVAGYYTTVNATGIYLRAGGSVTNLSTGTISGDNNAIKIAGGSGTVDNLGFIHSNDIPGQSGGIGIYLIDGGSVTNGAAGGTVSSAYILGYYGGVTFGGATDDTLTNYGTISGNPGNTGVVMTAGTLINGASGATGALIDSGLQSNAVLIGGAGTVANYGTIDAPAANGESHISFGVSLGGSGTVASSISNLGPNALIAGYVAVYAAQNATLTNAGTMEATQRYGGSPPIDAVIFGGGTNRLIVDPGAVFIGGVNGSGAITLAPGGQTTVLGITYGTGTTTLELASASSAGTLSGLGTTINNFASLVFDTGAHWTVTGNDSASGLGTLGISGFTFGDTIDLTGFVATSRTFTGNSLVLTDAGGAHDTLAMQGTFSTANVRIASDGSGGTDISLQLDLGYGDTIDQAGIVATTETVTAGVMTLFNGGGTAVGTIAVGGTLDSSDFTLAPDGSGGTDVIVSTIFGTYTSIVTLLTNPTTIAGTASISGTVSGIPSLYGPAGTAWTVTNEGSIHNTGNSTYGVSFAGGGTITNAAGGVVYGHNGGIAIYGTGASVLNLGQVEYSHYGPGIVLNNGGTVINGQPGGTASSASISGYNYGVQIRSNGASGEIGSVVNYGTIDSPGGKGVSLVNGAFVNGPSGATDAVVDAYVGVCITESGTVINFGTIAYTGSGNSGNYGILMVGAGTVGNAGLIEDAIGIEAHADALVLNAGSIVSTRGTSGVAIQFAGGTNLLVDEPGAVFVGSIIAAGTSTLELASGGSAGMLTGFGSTVTNFTSLVFDAGAQWTVAGNDSDAGLGTLGIGGFTLGDTIDLTGFAAVSSSFASNTLVLTDAGGAHDTLNIQGTFVSGNFHLSSDGAGGTDIVFGAPPLLYGETIDEIGIIATSETVTAGVMTLFTGASPVGTIAVGTTLDTGDFTLRPNGPTATDVIVSTVFGTYTSSVTLLTNPTTIAGTASITGTATSGIGVIGPSGTAWTLVNRGLVSETGTSSQGISFASAGIITNAAGGIVTGTSFGIQLNAGGSVTNQSGGTITGLQGIYLRTGSATVVNAGSIGGNITAGSGIDLISGGTVTNLAGGTISGSYGVRATAIATIVNAGSIGDGTSLPTGAAIALKQGGLLTNLAGGEIIAGLQGVYIGGAAGTVVNVGSIGGSNTTGNGVLFAIGGAVTNQSGGTITGKYGVRAVSAAVTVVNTGSIGGNLTTGGGVDLTVGGVVTNQSGGTITGLKAVNVTGGTVANTGSIVGNTTLGTGAGVELVAGGSFTNQSGGIVSGFAGVYGKTGVATVVNAGSIDGNAVSGRGVSLAVGGVVTNLSTGTITGFDGIFAGGGATVVNAGSIGGTNAVVFGSGAANRLVFDPGAVFSGTVDGGNTIGAAAVSTLELASNDDAGTLTGLGTQFANFANVTIDNGANWTLSTANTVVAGATLTNAGTLTATGTLVNAGTITGNELRLNGASFTNQAGGLANYVYGVPAGGTNSVVNQGTIATNTNWAIYLKAPGDVSNAAGALIDGYFGGAMLKGIDATLTNAGQIVGSTSDTTSYGAYLRNGGMIINGQPGAGTSTASIQGYYGLAFMSMDVPNAYGTLINSGTVIATGTEAMGVMLTNAGTVLNGQSGASSALIEGGRYGISAVHGSVFNDATIIAMGTADGGFGVVILGTGSIGNLAPTSLIEGYNGVRIHTDGTVTNAGTIASSQGASGVAVDFVGGNARLIDDPGAVFIGSIDGGTGGTAVLELASASSAGTITGLGGSVTNFTVLAFDSGAQWTVAGNDSASGLGTLGISGFTFGDTIDLTGFTAAGGTFASNTLVLANGVGDHDTLHIQGTFASDNFHLASDGTGGTDITFVIPPTIAAGGTVTFTGGGSPVTLDNTLGITDPNDTTLVSGTVSIGGFLAGDTLTFTDQNGIAGNFDSATGTLALTGSATLADYQAALDSITYGFAPADGDPTAGGDTTRTINWVVNDGTSASPLATSTLDIVHVAPTITTGGTVSFTGGGSAVVLDPTVSLTDPDSGGLLNGGTVSIGGFLPGDTLNFINQDGITGSFDGATGALTLTGSATLADYQTALDSVTYSFNPADGDPTGDGGDTSRTIAWLVTDGASTNGVSNTGTSTLDTLHVGPTIAAGGTVAYIADGIPAVLDSAVTITDADSAGTIHAATVSIGTGFTAGDELNFTNQNGITGGYDAVTGTLTLGGDATIADYQTALDSVTYTFTPDGGDPTAAGTDASRGISWTVNDGVDASAAASSTLDLSLPPPVIAGTLAGQTTTDEATIDPFSGVSITDPNSDQTEAITITVTNAGTLTDADGTLSGTGLTQTGTGTYTLTGSPTTVTAELDALIFAPTAHQVVPGATVTTGFTLAVTDTLNQGTTDGTTSVVATAANDDPVITGTVAGQTTTDEATLSPFSGVGISDVDVGQTETVTVTLSNAANGTLSNLDGGSYDSITGIYSITGSDADVTTAVDGLVFTPAAHQTTPGASVTTTFTIAATDTAGGTASDDTTTVAATAVNDNPVITGTVAGQTTTDEATLSPFSGVGISDVDFGQTETVTVTLSNAANGALSNLDGGSFDSLTGIYSVTGSDADVTTALDGLVFTPTAHQVVPGGSVTTTFTVATTDTAGGTATDDTTTVTATAVNDPPVITGTVAGQRTIDTVPIQPFSGVTIIDPDFGASETVTITLTDDGTPTDADGTLSGTGLTETGTGTYTLAAGSPDAVTAELDALIFTPTQDDLVSYGTITTGMTLSVTDGIVGTPTTDTTTSVNSIACFAAGTRIATARGAVAVERLREGDMVLTVSGKRRPIQWIGRRTLDCTRHIAAKRVKPVRIAPHAFGEDRPKRALLLSPDHSVFIEDVMIPIKHLINGATITQLDVSTVTYYHIELESHDVILAEGLPAETYLETGGRGAFENGGGPIDLHPDFAPDENRVGMVWRNFAYAPLIGTDGQLDRVRVRLALQAVMLTQQAAAAPRRTKRPRRSASA